MTAGVLSGLPGLQHLQLADCSVEPGVLAGKQQLQHVDLSGCIISGGASGGLVGFMSHLQPLQQLTYLKLTDNLRAGEDGNLEWRMQAVDGDLRVVDQGIPPAAAYAALTASSKLQHLDISSCVLPASVWQYVFPVGRQLPHLQKFDMADNLPSADGGADGGWIPAPAPDGSRLVSCCPGLQYLNLQGLHCSAAVAGVLGPLQGLHTLRTLCVSADHLTAGGSSFTLLSIGVPLF